jgi:hypothetical protein
MISLEAYWKGRDQEYADELTEDILANADRTVERVNKLLAVSGFGNVGGVNSGWRPQAVNDATGNAAKSSRHLSAEAIDIADPIRSLARWCLGHLDVLEDIGLWMEDPRWTPTWVHLQTVPPGSGRRVFIPSSSPPKAPPINLTVA